MQRQHAVVDLDGRGDIARHRRHAQLVHGARGHIGRHGDIAGAAAEHQRHRRRIVARVDGEAGGHHAQQLGAAADIARRVFHADDAGDLGQARDGLVGHVGNRAARHVVEDDGQVDGFGDRLEVLVHAFLGRTVVVGHHQQGRIGAHILGVARQLYGLGRGIATRSRDDGDAAGRVLDGQLDQREVFFDRDRGRLTRGADDHDAVGAFGDVPVDQFTQAGEVQTAVRMHRRDDCYNAALDHIQLIMLVYKVLIVADSPPLWFILD